MFPWHVAIGHERENRITKTLQVISSTLGVFLVATDGSVAKSTFKGETNLVFNMNAIFHEGKNISKVNYINLVTVNSKVFWLDIPVNITCGRVEFF